MNKIPSGNITFLFTDIEGSTKLAQKFPEGLTSALSKHNVILKAAIELNKGFIFEIIGDAFCGAFGQADDAVKAAVTAQRNLASEKWDEVVIKIRIGIHSGSAEWVGKRYAGYITLARTARVMATALGEQILISGDAYHSLSVNLPSQPGSDIRNGNFRISFRDLGERRLKDLIQPLKLYQVSAEGLREDFPPLKTLDARANNLPVQLTSFIGREEEMKQIKNLLNQTHLLTLTGPGGTGKTRIALQIAADVIDDFENGVWFTSLASLSDAGLLPLTIIQSLRISERTKKNAEDTLIDYLRDKKLLIILDNCEHIINGCAKLTEKLLQHCPDLKIMSTSREELRCSGELTHRTLTLITPDPEDNESPEQLMQYESIELFTERAQSVNPNFIVNEHNVKLIAAICHKLDGIPLAIELAAARTKILTVEKIFERLSDRFELLTSGLRTALPRQQTLRAMINWSYDLLSEKEKLMWSRLSVFSAHWTIEAAEAVCSDDEINKKEVIKILTDLTEKSIIIFDEEKSDFRMLETMRQYGEEKLKEFLEGEKISNKHLQFYLELAETADRELKGHQALNGLKILDTEIGNIVKALRWSVENSEIENGMRLTGAMGNFWKIRGYIAEGIRWFEIFLKKKPSSISGPYCRVLYHMGNFMRIKGHLKKAKPFFEECLKLSNRIEFKSGIAESLTGLGLIEYDKGQYEQAGKFYEKSLNVYYQMNDKSGIAHTLNNLGNVALDLGDVSKAYSLYEESLIALREIEDVLGTIRALNNFSIFAFERGEFTKAIELLQENLKFNRQAGNKADMGMNLNNLGIVAYHLEKYEMASDFYNESLDIYRELGEKKQISISLINLGSLKLEQGQTEPALKLFEESFSIGNDIGAKFQIALSLYGMGRTAFMKKEYNEAQKFYFDSLASYIELGSKKEIVVNILSITQLQNIKGHYIHSAKHLGFVKNYFESNKINLAKFEQNIFDEEIDQLKKELKNEFEKYFEEGKLLTMEQAIELLIKL